MSEPAIFLDRDGTIIEDVGIISDPADIKLLPDTFTALRRLQQRYRLFVVSNQGGVAQGAVTMQQVEQVNAHLAQLLTDAGINIEDWYVCPHMRADNCHCIKPKTSFLEQAAQKYELCLEKSFVIGDHPHDAVTGTNAGGYGLYVLTGHGQKHLAELPMEYPVFHTLTDATCWIFDHSEHINDLQRSIEAGAKVIHEGGLTAFPTETVYGLGADAFNKDAVVRIFEAKERPLEDPLIVHIHDIAQLQGLVAEIPQQAQALIDAFWPGPLTLVFKKSPEVPDLVTAGNPTVAVRMPAHPCALELIELAQTPIAAPSANKFGRTSPTTAAHVREQLGSDIDAVIDGGACRVGIESTVVSMVDEVPCILRQGGVAQEDIEKVIGKVDSAKSSSEGKMISPGLLDSHYAPVTPLIQGNPEEYADAGSDTGFMLFTGEASDYEGPVEILSAGGDLREAASNLYAALRRLDSLKLKQIITHTFPNTGLGRGINDRLKKASGGLKH